MKKLSAVSFILTFAGMTSPAALGQTPSPRASHPRSLRAAKAMQEVLAVDEERRLAMLHGDIATLGSVLAGDVTIIWGDGTADDKASAIAMFRSGRLRYSQLEYEGTRVRLYGRAAVVTGQARVTAQSDAHPLAHLVRVTRVYVRQQGGWRLVASQTTRIEPRSGIPPNDF